MELAWGWVLGLACERRGLWPKHWPGLKAGAYMRLKLVLLLLPWIELGAYKRKPYACAAVPYAYCSSLIK